MEKKVRGDMLDTWFKFIKNKWGSEGLDKAFKDIGIGEKIEVGRYYPFEHYEKLLEWVKETHGERYLQEGGRFIIKNLGLLAYIVRFISIDKIMKKIPK